MISSGKSLISFVLAQPRRLSGMATYRVGDHHTALLQLRNRSTDECGSHKGLFTPWCLREDGPKSVA
ncbi:hypothetical protein Pmani_007141 [Petrolisthes manimaculis]|uniref:Uncharacterized protein n=1 Tax=Petrolisthes manimaculis TaxID=1843537 RepID=A0AAE1Q8Z1_9EUCA|nr:hypothetical protein Pmani_007141 [Petrolisthes manimaculis]